VINSIVFGAPLSIGGFVVRHPTVRDILEYGEERYIAATNLFLIKPSDMMVELHDSGLDYTQVSQYEVFCLLCREIIGAEIENKGSEVQSRLAWLTGIDDFGVYMDKSTDDIFLFSPKTGATIDATVYIQIRRYLMQISFLSDKEKYNPGNEETKNAIIEQERARRKRMARRKFKSALDSQISCLVWGNTSGYKYDDVLDMPIYQFYDGLFRLNKMKVYQNIMNGFYSGNITHKELKKMGDDVDWMGPIKP
jgi:hypothetical protein